MKSILEDSDPIRCRHLIIPKTWIRKKNCTFKSFKFVVKKTTMILIEYVSVLFSRFVQWRFNVSPALGGLSGSHDFPIRFDLRCILAFTDKVKSCSLKMMKFWQSWEKGNSVEFLLKVGFYICMFRSDLYKSSLVIVLLRENLSEVNSSLIFFFFSPLPYLYKSFLQAYVIRIL